jgi:hypothetical protein
VAVPSNVHAALEIKAQEASFYKDMFEQGAYEGTSIFGWTVFTALFQ